MLSTSQSLICPTCGQQATIRLQTVRHRLTTRRDAFEAHLAFSCRSKCSVSVDVLRELCGMDLAAD